MKLLEEPFWKQEVNNTSIRYQGAKLDNSLRLIGVISSEIDSSMQRKKTKFCIQVTNLLFSQQF